MSETLIAVIVTGAVSIVASSLSPILTAIAQWQLSKASRRDETSSELLLLGTEALDAIREAGSASEKTAALLMSSIETLRLVDQEGGGMDSLNATFDAADRALTRLELRSTGEAVGVAAALRSALQRTSTDAYLMHTSKRFGTPGSTDPAIIIRDLKVVEDAVVALKLTLQPYTSTARPTRRESRLRKKRLKQVEMAVVKGLQRPREVTLGGGESGASSDSPAGDAI